MRRRLVPVLTLALVLPSGAAPGGGHEQALPSGLVGTWQRSVTGADIARAGGVAAFIVSPGVWRLTFDRTGSAALSNTPSGPPVSRWRTSIVAPGVIGVRFPGDDLAACRVRGTYRWRATARAITLLRQKDGCAGRVAVLAGTWRRAG